MRLQREEIEDRKKRNIKFIELSLDLDDLKDVTETLSQKPLLKENNLIIYAVRPPIKNSFGELCVIGEENGLMRNQNMSLIKQTIYIANKLSDMSNPLVIISMGGLLKVNEYSQKDVKNKRHMIEKDIYELKEYISENFPNMTLSIENNEMIKRIGNEEYVYAFGYNEDLIQCIRSFKDQRISICLNIDNAVKVIEFNKKRNQNVLCEDLSDYLDIYRPYLKLIQLSNSENLAFVEGNERDKETLQLIFKTISAIGYISPITINTKEEVSYLAENYTTTKKAIIKALQKN